MRGRERRTSQDPTAVGSKKEPLRGAVLSIAPHWLFALIFAAGLVLRILVWSAYRPALLLLGDTTAYLNVASGGTNAETWHPLFYAVFLKPAIWVGSLGVATAAQHALGLLMALGLYLLLLRLGVGPIVAALGPAPLLLDGYQLNLEQHILTEALFESLIVGSLLLLAWSIRGSIWMYAAAGGLIGLAMGTRFAGIAILPVALIYVLIRRVGWLRAVSVGVGFAVCLFGYFLWQRSVTGASTLTSRGSYVLYGKVATFADCRGVDLPELERQLCIDTPVSERQPSYNIWSRNTPLKSLEVPPGVDEGEIVGSFTRRFILRQPLDYARAVAGDFFRFFAWRSPDEQERIRVTRWQFFVDISEAKGVAPVFRESGGSPPPQYGIDETFEVNEGLARSLKSYQGVVYPSGPLLTLAALLGLFGSVWRRPGEGRDVRPEALLFTLAGAALLLFPATFAAYHYRYVIPAIPLLGAAGAMGASTLLHFLKELVRTRSSRDETTGMSAAVIVAEEDRA